MGDLRAVVVEAFRCLIPVSTNALRGQFDLLAPLVNCLAKSEVSDLDLAEMEDDILWLQVIVNDFLLLLIQIFQSAQNLRNYEFCFFFGYLPVLLQIKVKIRARAEL